MINKNVSPLVIGLFDTNLSQSPYVIDSPSSQLDPYTPPNSYQNFYASYKISQHTKP